MGNNNEAEASLYNHTDLLLKGHEALLSDANRNRPLYRALQKTVTKDSSVLDIGSGTGIWAVAAAMLGARKVVAVEEEPLLVGIIKDLAHENGVADRVAVVQGDSRQIDLAKEFDLVISETVGHLVFDESIASIMIDARERFLKPDGRLIPESVALMAAPAHLTTRHTKLPAGIRMTASRFESLALNIPIGLNNKARLRTTANAQQLVCASLAEILTAPDLGNLIGRWEISDTRRVNCFAVWAEVTLINGVTISTMQTSSWLPMIYRIKPFTQRRGEVEFKLQLTTNTNYWTVTLINDQREEVQSYSPAFAATELLARTRMDTNVFSHYGRSGVIDEPLVKNLRRTV